MYGPHLILEGYDCRDRAALASTDAVQKALSELPGLMEMNIIMPPRVLQYDGGDIGPEDGGVTGFVIIAESHLAIHTYPEKGFFTLDIFSCKPFEVSVALDYILAIFQPQRYDHQVFERGREFPRCISRATEIVEQERAAIALQVG